AKDRAIRSLASEVEDKERAIRSLSTQLTEQTRLSDLLSAQVAEKETKLAKITNTMAWRVLSIYGRKIKYPYLLRFYRLYGKIKYPYLLPLYKRLGLMPSEVTSTDGGQASKLQDANKAAYHPSLAPQGVFSVADVESDAPLTAHHCSVDVVICVHNALKE